MTTPQQLDLFSGGGAVPPEPDLGLWAPTEPTHLSDQALIAVIPRATQNEAAAFAREAVRRGLRDAIPALESLCRRFMGFGLEHEVSEQITALNALATLGARDAVTRLIDSGAVRGPGRRWAMEAAASLRCRLAAERLLEGLRDNDPATRAAACRCARGAPGIATALIDLLADLHVPVVQAAAIALGRMGHREGTVTLLRLLRSDPSSEIISALAPIARDDEAVLLGQTALTHPDLADQILAALDDCEAPRAAIVAAGVRRRLFDREPTSG